MVKLNNRTSKGKKGAALVEFALAFPVFIFLIFMAIDLGLYFYYQSSMSDVVRSTLRNVVTGNLHEGDGMTRRKSAIIDAKRHNRPLLDLDATDNVQTDPNDKETPIETPNDTIVFLDPETNKNLANDLGGPEAKIKMVYRQKVSFITPLNKWFGLIGGDADGWNMKVSAVYQAEDYIEK